jgi:hypothetical protein
VFFVAAVTHQRHVPPTSHLLEESQGELPTTILDILVAIIETDATAQEFAAVAAREFGSTDFVVTP